MRGRPVPLRPEGRAPPAGGRHTPGAWFLRFPWRRSLPCSLARPPVPCSWRPGCLLGAAWHCASLPFRGVSTQDEGVPDARTDQPATRCPVTASAWPRPGAAALWGVQAPGHCGDPRPVWTRLLVHTLPPALCPRSTGALGAFSALSRGVQQPHSSALSCSVPRQRHCQPRAAGEAWRTVWALPPWRRLWAWGARAAPGVSGVLSPSAARSRGPRSLAWRGLQAKTWCASDLTRDLQGCTPAFRL